MLSSFGSANIAERYRSLLTELSHLLAGDCPMALRSPKSRRHTSSNILISVLLSSMVWRRISPAGAELASPFLLTQKQLTHQKSVKPRSSRGQRVLSWAAIKESEAAFGELRNLSSYYPTIS